MLKVSGEKVARVKEVVEDIKKLIENGGYSPSKKAKQRNMN